MDVKGLVASIVQFLTQQLEDGGLSADSRESLEVAIQCLESAYNVQTTDAPLDFNLMTVYKLLMVDLKPSLGPEATPAQKAEAECLKNEGNRLLKADRLYEALNNYTQAIELDGRNAVYYCNRAAVNSKIGNYEQVIKDCETALTIDPQYSKAYGRMGLAYSSLKKHKEAKECYKKAIDIDPDNESYKTNLKLTEENLSQQEMESASSNPQSGPSLDFGQFLRHPAVMQMARQMITDPNMQNVVSNIMSGTSEQGDRIEALIEAGQQLAHQMENSNPDLLETLRRQMGGNEPENDPNPPQPN